MCASQERSQNGQNRSFLGLGTEQSGAGQQGLHRIFKRVAKDASEAILVTEAQLEAPGPRILWANEAFSEITGYEPGEVVGKTPRILQGPDTEEAVLEQLRVKLEAGERFEGETVNYRKDGTPYINHWSIAPIYGENGEIRYWVSVQRDVTEKRRLQEGIVQALDEERRRIGRTLHDAVGSEIVAASMRLDNVATNESLADTVAEKLQDIRASIVEGYDNLRRLSQGLSPVDLSEGSLAQALARLASNTSGAEFDSSVNLDAVLAGADMDTLGNLYWIVYEAVRNAEKHGKANSVQISASRDENMLSLTVEDDGVGFDVAEKEEEAWGLRLMSYRADLLGASLNVESDLGNGTRVECRLEV